jgi:hypothetical protein
MKQNLQNVDARHLRPGKAWARKGAAFIVATVNAAFTLPGVVLFITGVLFALTLNGRFQ